MAEFNQESRGFIMKKSLIAAALAAAVAAPVAHANVVIYGNVHLSIDHFSDGDGNDFDDYWAVTSRSSYIGFKGTEDLGNGLSLIWKAETTYDFSDGSAWDSGRNAYIGLAGDWGTFLYGRHDAPYKLAIGSTGIDQMGDTILDMTDIAGFEENRYSNAIAYVSPSMNGLTLAAAMVPGEGDFGTGLADGYSLGAMYSNNGLKLAAGYENVDGDDAWMVGAGYTMNSLQFAIVYEDDDDLGDEETNLGISVGYSFGNSKAVLVYGREDNDGDDTEHGWGVGLKHNLSKRTSAYVAYATTDENELAGADEPAEDGFSIGLQHKF
jgi:predicted porin